LAIDANANPSIRAPVSVVFQSTKE